MITAKNPQGKGANRRRQEIRTISGSSELTAGSEAIGHEALKEDGLEVGACEVDGCCVSCRSRANDHLHRATSQLITHPTR